MLQILGELAGDRTVLDYLNISGALVGMLFLPVLTFLGGEADDAEDSDRGGDPQVRWLRSVQDLDGLFQLMQRDQQLTQGLEAAEALAELGDVRGLDHLIGVLRGPSAYMRREAAASLKRLGHPRGLDALQGEEGPASASSPVAIGGSPSHPAQAGGAASRAHFYDELSHRSTDDLMAIWHESDRAQWPDPAFDVLREILTKRLGQPPAAPGEASSTQGRAEDEIDENVDPRIQRLWLDGDLERLRRVLDRDEWPMQLEAAEALADLGDEAALDFLIEALDDPLEDVRDMAAEILEWLDLPRGNAALQQHGIEFDEDSTGVPKVEEDETPPSAPAEPAAPAATSEHQPVQPHEGWAWSRPDVDLPAASQASPGDVWAAYRQRQMEFEARLMQAAPEAASGAPQAPPEPAASARSNAILLGGIAAGAAVWPMLCVQSFLSPPTTSHTVVEGDAYVTAPIFCAASLVAATLGAIGGAAVTRWGNADRSPKQLNRLGIWIGVCIGLLVGAASVIISLRLICTAPGRCPL